MKNLKLKQADLKKLTWLKCGGEINIFKPESIEEISQFVKVYKDFFILGAGSNVLASNEFKKTVLRLGREFNYVRYQEKNPERIIAGAATLDSTVAKFALENNIKNFEFLSVIPGTIGGAIAMNAGAYGGDISKILMRATAIDEHGEIVELTNYEMGFKYRGTTIPKNWIIVEAGFKVEKCDSALIKEITAKMLQQKHDSQPVKTKTCGSVFKNPSHGKAWELIEKAGFRGYKIGKAEISSKHCNFLINHADDDTDHSEDLIKLCHMVQNKIEKDFCVKLEFELIIV